jgi:UDP-glucose 4-epimerase
MRAFVTGGTGFLGSYLVRAWAARYGTDAVTCLVPVQGTDAELATCRAFGEEGIVCIEGDVCRSPVADDVGGNYDVLFHLAAATNTSWSEEQLAPVNVQGTRNLLATFRGRLRGKRIVFTSTSAAVDRAGRPRGPLTETSPCQPRTAYGCTKLAAERILAEWCTTEGATYTIARLTTLYGRGVRTGLIPVLAAGLQQGKLSARLDWPGRVSLLYIDDAVRLLTFLAASAGAANECFFLSSGEAIRVGDLIAKIGGRLAPDFHPARLPRWMWRLIRQIIWLPGLARVIPWRLLHVLDDGLWCDNAKVRQLYPDPLVTLDEGLARTFAPRVAETAGAQTPLAVVRG